MMIVSYGVKRILADNENLVDILFYYTFQIMKLLTGHLRKVNMPLARFSRDSIIVEGKITLPVIVRKDPQ